MAGSNYYELLGVSPTAKPEEIKDAFRDAMYRYHPDHNPGKEDWAVEKTMELVQAYHILSDPNQKAKYDLEVQHVLRREFHVEVKGLGIFAKKEDKEKAKQAEEAFRTGVLLYAQPEKRTLAATEFLKATKFAPQNWEAYYNLALTLAVLGRFQEATSILGKAAPLAPEQTEIRRLQSRLSQLVFGTGAKS